MFQIFILKLVKKKEVAKAWQEVLGNVCSSKAAAAC